MASIFSSSCRKGPCYGMVPTFIVCLQQKQYEQKGVDHLGFPRWF
jgi:hypothetical protein